MHIGLIGGIGNAATVAYYQRLTAAMAAKGQPLELTIVQADAPTLVRNNKGNNRAAQAEIYRILIERLKASGCDCAAITSLGGHFCYAETEAVSTLPLISGVTPIDQYFAANGIETVGLMGTEVVMRTRLYGQLKKTQAVIIEGRTPELGKAYLDMALSGQCTDMQRQYFIEAGQTLSSEYGADAVLLAGTDLGLAFDGQETPYRVIDALDIHVDLLAKLACDEIGLDALETT